MKHLILLLAILVLSGSCGSSDETFLSGEIKGLQNDTLLFYGADQTYPHIDTIVAEKGKFKVSLPVDTLTSAYLYIKSLQKELPVYIDRQEQVRLTTDTVADLFNTTVTGNKHSQELYDFLRSVRPDNDSVRRQKAMLFIRQHPFSFADLFLLDHFLMQQEQPDYALADSLINTLGGTLRDTPFIQRITSHIKQDKNLMPGKVFPYFNLPSSLGRKITRMNTFRDKILIVHLWASWHPESRISNQALREVYGKFRKEKDFDMLGISFDTDKRTWNEAIQADSMEWTQAYVPDGLASKTKEQYAIESLPVLYLLDRAGRIKLRSNNLQELTDSLSAMLRK